MNKRYIRNIAGDIYDYERDKFYHEDYEGKPLGYEDDVVKQLNKQDQQIKDIEKLLDDELEKASINRERWDEPHPAAEYFKGYHCGVGDLKKKIRHILFNE